MKLVKAAVVVALSRTDCSIVVRGQGTPVGTKKQRLAFVLEERTRSIVVQNLMASWVSYQPDRGP